jgi:uronate dehydrogenase
MTHRVLLTGAAGKLGRRLRAPLAQRYPQLRSSDLVAIADTAHNEEFAAADLSDEAQVKALVSGVDAIVHFGGYPREAGWDTIIPANIIAVTNLWEAALEAGVKKIVYASSNHVIGFHPVERTIGVTAEVKPDSRYGVSKAFTETVARFYYEKFGLESLGLRIGRCEDLPTDSRMLSTWIHPDDLFQLVVCGIEQPVRADVVYGVSANSRSCWSNEGLDHLAYKPAHSADDFVAAVESAAPAAPSAAYRYQGGPFADAQYRGDPERAANYSR